MVRKKTSLTLLFYRYCTAPGVFGTEISYEYVVAVIVKAYERTVFVFLIEEGRKSVWD